MYNNCYGSSTDNQTEYVKSRSTVFEASQLLVDVKTTQYSLPRQYVRFVSLTQCFITPRYPTVSISYSKPH